MKTICIMLLVFVVEWFSAVCLFSCGQGGRQESESIISTSVCMLEPETPITLFVQGDNFQYQRKDGTYAPLGIGFLEVVVERKPIILLYSTAECMETKDSILLLQHSFDHELIRRGREIYRLQGREREEGLLVFWDSIRAICPDFYNRKDGCYYYRYTSPSDTLLPLGWREGSNSIGYLEETESLIYTFPRLRFRVLEMTERSLKIVLNEETGRTAWVRYDSPEQIVNTDGNLSGYNYNYNYNLMRTDGYMYDFYYLSWKNYLKMVRTIHFTDGIKLDGHFEVSRDSIRSQRGGEGKLWRKGNRVLIDWIVEYYVE